MNKWKIKDFEIKSYRIGSRLKTGAEWGYRIVWNNKEVKCGFTRKSDALDFVKKLVRIQNREIDKLTV